MPFPRRLEIKGTNSVHSRSDVLRIETNEDNTGPIRFTILGPKGAHHGAVVVTEDDTLEIAKFLDLCGEF